MLCDGASPENIASTVVDCTKIETGHIGFFRVGLIPKSKVIYLLVLLMLDKEFHSSVCLHLYLLFLFVRFEGSSNL